MPSDCPTPASRVILLGASNLTRAISPIFGTAQRILGSPLDVMSAIGHGRSYGLETSVLGRRLPGIVPCRLWEDLTQRPPLPTYGLITDIGNDILYGVPESEILTWIGECVARLTSLNARIVLTRLPLASVSEVGNARFSVLRRVLFPNSSLTRLEAIRRAEAIDEAVTRYASQSNVAVIQMERDWYGIDPIHIRIAVIKQAWPRILNEWRNQESELPIVQPRTSLWRALYLRSRTPCERSFGKWTQRRDQPSGRWNDGSSISLY